MLLLGRIYQVFSHPIASCWRVVPEVAGCFNCVIRNALLSRERGISSAPVSVRYAHRTWCYLSAKYLLRQVLLLRVLYRGPLRTLKRHSGLATQSGSGQRSSDGLTVTFQAESKTQSQSLETVTSLGFLAHGHSIVRTTYYIVIPRSRQLSFHAFASNAGYPESQSQVVWLLFMDPGRYGERLPYCRQLAKAVWGSIMDVLETAQDGNGRLATLEHTVRSRPPNISCETWGFVLVDAPALPSLMPAPDGMPSPSHLVMYKQAAQDHRLVAAAVGVGCLGTITGPSQGVLGFMRDRHVFLYPLSYVLVRLGMSLLPESLYLRLEATLR